MEPHQESHPHAGATVFVVTPHHHQFGEGSHEFHVKDWWDKENGSSWIVAGRNPAVTLYGLRREKASLPMDDEVVYGKIDGIPVLVHDSEILRSRGGPVSPATGFHEAELVAVYGKTSDQLADEAERGYPL